jgi:predicted XRE-type DNA-binding protein
MNCLPAAGDELPDPEIWHELRVRQALEEADFGAVFRELQRYGYSQARIGHLTGHTQPEVSAIIHGRRVHAFSVVRRIGRGLGIPPALLGLACDGCPQAQVPTRAHRQKGRVAE